MTKLTKARVDRIRPGETIWDGEVSGFGVRKQRRDAIFIMRYRVHRRQRYVTIGRLGAPWTVETARNEARRLWGMIAEGRDPAERRDHVSAALAVANLMEAYMTRHVATKRKSSTAVFYRRILNTHVLPRFGTRLAIDVSRSDVANLHNDIAEKREDGTGGRYAANRTLAVIGAAYAWAARAGLIEEGVNPAHGVELFKESPRQRFLTWDELGRLGAAVREARISPSSAAAIRLLILTGCRRSEILRLEWRHVDFERRVLFLPDSKSGKKTVPLSAQALNVLANASRLGRYVVAGEKAGQADEKPRADLKDAWKHVTKHAGLEGLRIHDLRHTFASIGAAQNMSLPLIGSLLGHSNPHTTAMYAHLAVDPLHAAADRIASHAAEAMGEKSEGTTL